MILLRLICFSIIYRTAAPFAQWMLDSYCSTPLKIDEIIMNSPVIQSIDRSVHVYRGPTLLRSNIDSYMFDEELSVTISEGGKRSQHIIEIISPHAKLIGGGCNGKRTDKETTILQVLKSSTSYQPLTLRAGWADGHQQVKISRDFILLPPTSSMMLNYSISNARRKPGAGKGIPTASFNHLKRKANEKNGSLEKQKEKTAAESSLLKATLRQGSKQTEQDNHRLLYFLYAVLTVVAVFAIYLTYSSRFQLRRELMKRQGYDVDR